MKKFRSLLQSAFIASLLLFLSAVQASAQCVSPPTATVSGGCPNATPTLTASGLAPGGNGSNTSGVLTLNGSNQYLASSSAVSLSGATALTIEYWFKGSNCQSAVRMQPGGYIVAGWNNPPVHILSDDGGSGNGVPVDATGNSVIYNGSWHHVAMTWAAGGSFTSYLDGVQQGTRASLASQLTIAGTLYIGCINGNGEFTNGSMDNVRIWTVCRTQTQLQTDMFLETPSDATGLLVQYKMNGDYTCANNSAYNATGGNSPGFAAANYYTYTWSGTNAPSASTSEVQAVTSASTPPQDYSVTAAAAGFCASSTATVHIGVACAEASQAGACSGGTVSLTATGYTGSIQWQSSATNTSGDWSDISGATTSPYVYSFGSSTTYFRAVGDISGTNDTSNVITIAALSSSFVTSQPIASTSGSCTGTVNLTASGLVPGGQGSDTSGVLSISGGSYAKVSVSSALYISGDFTFEFWVKPTSWIGTNTYFCDGNWYFGPSLYLRQDNSGNSINLYVNGSGYGSLGYIPPLNSWTHLALVRSGSTVSLYANGTFIGNFTTGFGSDVTPTADMGIGVSMHNGGEHINGYIDEFRYWKGVAVSSANLNAYRFSEVTSAHPNYANLNCEFKFNGDYTDATGNCTGSGVSSTFAAANYYTYTWSGPSAPASSTNEVQAATGTAPLDYTLVAAAPGACPSNPVSVHVGAACANAEQSAACAGSMIDLNLSGYTGAIQWQSSTSNSPFSWAGISGATSASYIYTMGNATTYFRALVANSGDTDISNTIVVEQLNTILSTPQPSASASGGCTGTISLTATGLVPGGQGSNSSGVVSISGGSYVNISASSATAMPGDFTYEFWVKPTSWVGTNTYISNGDWYSGPSLYLRQDNSGGTMNLYINGSGYGSLGYIPPLNAWTHLALERSGSTITLYANGSAVGNFSSYGSPIIPSYDFGLGCSKHNGNEYLNGYIDEFRYWNGVALSQATLNSYMFSEITSSHPNRANLSCEFRFDGDYTDATGTCSASPIGGSVSFAAANYYTFQWTGASAPSSSGNEVQTVTGVTLPQDYTLVAIAPGACPSSPISVHIGSACASASQTTACSGNNVLLSVTGYTGTIQWQSSASNSPYSWSDLSGGTTSSFTTPMLNTTTAYFRAVITNGADTDYSNTVAIQALVTGLNTPVPTASSTGSCSGTTNLIATRLVPGGQGSNSSGVLSISSGSYVNISANSALAMPGDFTYELWVKPTGWIGTNTYISNGNWYSGPNLYLRQDNGGGTINLYINGGGQGSLGYTPPLNVWTHLALERSGSTITLFANGSAVGIFTTTYGSAIIPTSDFGLGESKHNGGEYFNGYIDEFRYWNGVAISSDTLNAYRFSELTSAHPNWANLSCELKFNGDYSDATGICRATPIGTTSFAAANFYTFNWSGTSAPSASLNEVQTLTGAITPPQDYTLVATAPGACPSNPVSVHVGAACAQAGLGAVCAGNSVLLSVSGYTGSIQWQSSAGNNPYSWSNISGGTTTPFSASVGSSTTYFQAVIANGGDTDISNTIEVQVLNSPVSIPQPVASSTGGCSGNANLIVSGLIPGGQGSNSSGVLSISSGAYVNVAANSVLTMPGDFTYEIWVKPTNFTNNNTYFSNGYYNNGLLLGQSNPGVIYCYLNGNYAQLNYAPPLNVWTHLALERSGATVSLYANGVLIGVFTSSYSSSITPGTDLGIGVSKHAPGSEYFIGYLDEFRFWKGVALSTATLNSYRLAELTPAHPNWANLGCEFKFNGDYSDATGTCNSLPIGATSFAGANFYTFTWTGASAPAASGNEVQTLTGSITPPQDYTLVVTVAGACPSNPLNVHVGAACAAASLPAVCAGSNVVLSVSGYTGTIQWQSSASNSPYSWSDISGGTTTPYITPFGSATTYYRAVITNGANTDISNTVEVQALTTSLSIPQPVASATRICSGNATLIASGMVPGGQGSNTSGVLSISGGAFVNVTTNSSLAMPGDFTYELWVKPNSFTSENTYFSNGYYNNGMMLRQGSPSSIECWFNGNYTQLTYAPPINVWTHLAVVRSGANVSLYANGGFVGYFTTGYSASMTPGTDLGIGVSKHAESSEYFNGYIDEFRYWNGVALSPATINAYRFGELTSSHPNWSNLTCEFKFDGDYTDAKGICTGSGIGTTAFAAANYYTFDWSGVSAPSASGNEVQTLTAAVTPPQSYILVVTSPGACPTNPVTVNVYGNCASASQSVACSGNSVTLNLYSYTGSIQWQSSATNTSGDWQDVSLATYTPYAYAFTGSTTYLRAIITNGGNTDTSDVVTINAISNSIAIPTPTVANSGMCGSSTPKLTITGLVPGGMGNDTSGVLSLNGSNQYVTTDLTSLAGTTGTALTIEYWFKGTTCQSAVRQNCNGCGNYIVAGWQNGNPAQTLTHILSFDGGSGAGINVDATGNTIITNGQWHHVAMTWQANTTNGFCSYLDGVLQASRNSANTTIPNFNTPVEFGRYQGNTEWTNGDLDNVRIWSVARTQAQLQTDMFNETPSDSTGLLAQYKFNGDFTCSNNPIYNGGGTNNPVFTAPNYYTYTWTGTNAPAASGNEVQTVSAAITAPQTYTLVASAPNFCPSPTATTYVGASCASADQTAGCSGGTVNLSLSQYTGSIQWQSSATNTTGDWQNISGAVSTPYAYTFGSSTTYFRAVVTNGGSGDTSNTVTVAANTVVIPTQPTASNSGICSGTPSLTASGMVPGGQGSNTSGTISQAGTSFVNVTNNSKLNMPGDFTYEMWVYPTSWNNYPTYFSNGAYTSGIILLQLSSTQIQLAINGNSNIFNCYYAPPLNAWTHFALERSGSTISLYANGNQVCVFTTSYGSASTPTASLFIGGRPDLNNPLGNQGFTGKIDEFRYWNGIALDPTTIKSRMTRELTAAERSSSYLSCEFKFNGDFTDATGNCSAIGVLTSFAPANYYTYTWSGTNAPAASTNEVQTVTGSVTAPITYSLVASAPNGCSGASASTTVSATCATANVAVACPGNTVNLTLANSTGAIQWQSSSSSFPYIWQNISGATTSTYAYTFGTSTTYFRALSAGGTDSSNTITVSVNNQIIQQPIAGSSGSCGGPQPTLTASGLVPGGQGSNTSGVVSMSGSSYVNVTSNAKLQMTGDFTYEMWVYPTSFSNNPTYFSNGPYNNGILFWQTSSNNIQLYINTGGSGNYYNLSYGPPLNAWTHIALERSGLNISLYANGSLVGNFPLTYSTAVFPTANLCIGGRPDNPGGNGFIGYIDEFRYWNGIAIDTATLKSRLGRELTSAERSSANLSCEFKFNGDYQDATGNLTAAGVSTSFAAANYYTYTWSGSNAPSASTNEVQITTAAITPPQTYSLVASIGSACPSPASTVRVGGACASADQTNACPGDIVNLSLTNAVTSVQWQSSSSNSPYSWQDISGATTTPYAYTFQTSTTYMRAVVVNGGNPDTSNIVSVVANRFTIIPSQPVASNTVNCSGGPTLTVTGLVPGGQGSNSSGVVSMTGGSYVNVPANTKLQMPGDFTYEMWFYITSFNNNPTYFSNGTESNGLHLLQTSASNIQLIINNSGYNLSYAPSATAWTHLALERSGSTITLYINGSPVGNFTTSFGTGIIPSANLFIGGRPDNPGGNGFIGNIDEFRYWKGIALDTITLKSRISRELTSGELSSSNLSCEFKFNGNYLDATGNFTATGSSTSFVAANYYTYTWSGSNAPAASTNEVQTATGSITAPQLYTVRASLGTDCPGLADTTSVGGCASVSVPTVTCLNETTDLSLSSYSGTIQWQSSPDSINFTNISGATTSPYTATLGYPVNYFRAIITNGSVVATSSTAVANVSISAANFNLGISGSNSVTVNGTASLCIANPIPSYSSSQPTGGTITSAGGYRIHQFTTPGSDALVVPAGFNANAEVLVVAGGGGGGTNMGGGGGGGGVIDNTTYALSPGSISLTVGAGGAGAPAFTNGNGGSNTYASSGANSVFGSLTAIGGGYGGTGINDNPVGISLGAAGGSGGGASGYNDNNVAPGVIQGGAGTAGQGYRGGNQGNQYYSGGGGGAGGQGADANNTANGGPGILSSVLGTAYYWGGGGGGAGYSIAGGNGGIGGGGGGAVGTSTGGAGLNNGSPGGGGCTGCQANEPGGNAGANTGGGGGGGSHYTSNNNGGNGGSGIVIVRYPDITQGAAWSSSNTSIATVDSVTGIVTGVGAGTCNIIYSAGFSGCAVQLAIIPFTVTTAPATICVGGAVPSGITENVNPPCTGGSVTTSGGYRIHVFTSNGTFNAPSNFNGNVEAFIVAGGGGGGSFGGGGGAGGLIHNTSFTVTSGSYAVKVGAGGVGAASSDVINGNGANGSNSIFSSLIAIGGGGGGTRTPGSNNYVGADGNAGGSGGGGANSDNTPGGAGGAGTSGQGNAGGAGGSGTGGTPNYSSGGGGGAGGVGMTGKTNGTAGATGGVGLQFTQFASFGGSPAGWFAGGGGGNIYTNGTDGIGGTGGGGNGGDNVNNIAAANGIANTGGGGGGATYQRLGGTGGSGIVIIKYPVSPVGAWMSSNTGVATVDSVGNVTGASAGTATITYTLTNGSCTSVQTSQVTVVNVAVGTASAADAGVCTGNNTTLTLTGNSGTGIQWQQSADGTTGWADVTGGSGATTTAYVTPPLTSTTYYRVQTTGSCVSYSNVVQVASTPAPPAVYLTVSGVTSLVVNGTSNLCAGTALPTGGTISSSGGYRIHKFTTTGSDQFIVPAGFSTTAKVLVVGGGGGGGQTIGGGGGGGGIIYNSSFALTPQTYSVSVGAGGAGRPGNGNASTYGSDGGAQGSNSVFASYTAIGGGGGGSYNQSSNGATSGGSGGGIGAGNGSSAVAGTAGQGYAGGISQSCNVGQCIDGAGGGGAGGVGGNSSVGVSGAGGSGISNNISGTATYYGGGGGGGARGVNAPNNQQDGGAGGAGGTGGGGTGGAGDVPGGISGSAGTTNTGGGGGGGGYLYNGAETTGSGGNGGSGIVIVSYPDVSGGGTWSSSNSSVATVNSTSGLVTGVSPGTANIIYTVLVGGCMASSDTATITVSAAIPAICVGGTTTTGVMDPSNPTASGGNTIASVNGYEIHTFTSSGTFTPPAGFNTNVDVLVVAAGGSGGGSNGSDIAGGGGGAGGLIYTTGYTVIPGSAITVTVGAGGTGNSGFVNGTNGGNSVFGSITALGGGYGGTWTIAPTVGGSGGGAGENGQSLVGAAGTSGQGYGGGNGNSYINGAPNSAGGGGGGAGGAGASETSNINGGNGGVGVANSITGTSVYYAGGGGGAGGNTAGTGGQGGGGSGKGLTSGNGTAGTANTGGGGGGALTNGNDGVYTAGNGGSGVVIVRYLQQVTGTWASTNTSVATVDTTGLVTGVGAGTTTISFTYTSSGCTSVQTAQVTVNSATTGTISASDPSICTGSNTILTLTGNSGTGIQWQQSTDGTSWANVTGGSGATTTAYTTPNLTQLTYYRVQTSGQCSAYSSAFAVTVNPQPSTVTFGITGATSLPVNGTSSLCAANYPTGGTVTVSGGYRIHEFSSSGTDKLIVPAGFSATSQVLVVAGGGGGGTNMGGGGGGGGVIYNSGYALSSGNISVFVGNGGAGAPPFTNNNGGSNTPASSGENSVFGSLTAIGGGAGGTGENSDGNSFGSAGGSGGGASGYNNTNASPGTTTGGSGTAGQGNRGGNQGNQYYSGGGGGAGGAGADGNNQPNGGPGILCAILGTNYYWGGGGGGAGYSSFGGNGGIGGGGGGAVGPNTSTANTGGAGLNNGSPGGIGCQVCEADIPGGNAGANTGGGGGAGPHYNSNNHGGNGGSGIVVVSYPDVPAGTWTSNNTGVATVDASSGVVTGVSAGTVDINYTVKEGGCIVVNQTVTVTVTAPTSSICIGGQVTPALTASQSTPDLTGGTVSTAGGYTINTFTSNGTLVVPSGFNVPVEVLVVAGGGGGGTNMGGGGGGGGVIDSNSYILSPGNISVAVGSGGAGAPAFTNGNGGSNTLASAGGNSTFGSSLTAIGGGAGGSGENNNPIGISAGGSGGSGGGASGYNNTNVSPGTIQGGTGTAGQGYRGGNQGTQFYSGGGGGAAGPGGDGNSKPNGGPGVANSILGTEYYWGGGGGGAGYTGQGGNGGAGGGGGGAIGPNGSTANPGGIGLNNGSPGGIGNLGNSGTPNVPGGNAGANTGGGGGGGTHYNSNNYGGNGGSGIVIVRYKKASVGTFTSSNTSIATVDANTGQVTGVANGNVTITYTLNDGTCTTTQTAPITVGSPLATAGTAVSTCSNSGAVNITAGSSASNYSSIAWTSSGSGTFANTNSITAATYTPSADDSTAGSVTLTLTANATGSCPNATDTKTLTIATAPTAVAGSALSTCSNSGAVDITPGSSASNYTSVAWTSSGTGSFVNANSLTSVTYTPSSADITAGSVILTLTANANSPCANATDTKTLTITTAPTAVAGNAVSTCSSSGAVNITSGSSGSSYASVTWTSNGSGSFSNANSLTAATYTPSADDITAGSVTLTLTASANGTCENATDTKMLTITIAPTAVAGSALSTCSNSGAVDITGGSSASNYSSVAWTSSGTGSFVNANSLTGVTYTPSAGDITAGSITLTLTANANGTCSNAIDTKTLTISTAPTAVAGSAISTCSSSGAVNVTSGSSASNYASLTWTSNGSGSFANANSLTAATYTPSGGDITAGSVTLTLTATGNGACGNAVDTKTLTISTASSASAGTAVSTCSNSGAVNITAGSSASNYSSVAWTSSGTGSFANPNSLAAATYTPSSADITAGSVTLTLTANANGSCVNAVDTKTLTITIAATAVAGSAVTTCSNSGAVNITAGSSASNYASVTWTSSGTGTFANANSLTTASYTPSSADKTAGRVTLTLTANANGSCSNAVDTKTLTINNCAFSYTVKCFIQGYYLGGGAMSPLSYLLGSASPTDVDTVTIELHGPSAPYDSLYAYKGVIQSNGNIVTTFGSGAFGSFYIVVKHRNSIDTWSASPQDISSEGIYDFTTGAGQAFGNNMINAGEGVYAIYSGDVNRDGAIDASDKTALQSALSSFLIGVYNVNDLTGDGFVDEDDYRILQNNVLLGITVSHP